METKCFYWENVAENGQLLIIALFAETEEKAISMFRNKEGDNSTIRKILDPTLDEISGESLSIGKINIIERLLFEGNTFGGDRDLKRLYMYTPKRLLYFLGEQPKKKEKKKMQFDLE